MGYVQTPVLFGYVEGGLILPSLRRGAEYFKAFPEQKGARIAGRIKELAVFGLPQALLDEWAEQYSSGLNDLQISAVNEHRVLDGESLLVVGRRVRGKPLSVRWPPLGRSSSSERRYSSSLTRLW